MTEHTTQEGAAMTHWTLVAETDVTQEWENLHDGECDEPTNPCLYVLPVSLVSAIRAECGAEAVADPLGEFDNTRDRCPACGEYGQPCERDGLVHDACLGHIEGATSACCGHGIDIGHVLVGAGHGFEETAER